MIPDGLMLGEGMKGSLRWTGHLFPQIPIYRAYMGIDKEKDSNEKRQ